jgi:type IV secretory pathway VirB10-like protein
MHVRITLARMPITLLVAIASLSLAGSVGAEVYTWKDASGQVHYSDQPPPNVEAKTTKPPAVAKYAPVIPDATTSQSAARAQSEPKADTKPPATQSGPKTWQEKDQEAKQRRAAEQEAEAKRKQEESRAEEKKRYCEGLRSNLAMLERGGRVTTSNAQGERVFLDDTQIKQDAERTRGQLARDCK